MDNIPDHLKDDVNAPYNDEGDDATNLPNVDEEELETIKAED